MRPCGVVAVLVAVLVSVLALSGCRPLYVPLVPTSIPFEERLSLGPATRLTTEQQRFKVTLELTTVPAEGWLSVQWFDPAGRQVAADSSWITRLDEGAQRSLFAPPTVVPTPGRWWAIVSFEGDLIRQLFTLVAD